MHHHIRRLPGLRPTGTVPPRRPRHSGEHGIADAYESGFWFIDQLGTLASMGHAVMCRQCFVGGNCEHAMRGLAAHSNGFQTIRALAILMSLLGKIKD